MLIKEVRKNEEEITNLDFKAKIYFCDTLVTEGITGYSDSEGGNVYIDENLLYEMAKEFVGVPIYIEHINELPTETNKNPSGYVSRCMVGKGKVGGDMLVFDKKAQQLLESDWEFSSCWTSLESLGGGTHNGLDYKTKPIKILGEHVAIVLRGRHESQKISRLNNLNQNIMEDPKDEVKMSNSVWDFVKSNFIKGKSVKRYNAEKEEEEEKELDDKKNNAEKEEETRKNDEKMTEHILKECETIMEKMLENYHNTHHSKKNNDNDKDNDDKEEKDKEDKSRKNSFNFLEEEFEKSRKQANERSRRNSISNEDENIIELMRSRINSSFGSFDRNEW